MMVVILGGLQSIAGDYFEAAEIDGASRWQQFRSVTLPMLRPVLGPAVTLGTIWTFNNFNVIFLVTMAAARLRRTDILVTALYNAAFGFSKYGFAAMFSLVIFAILFTFCLLLDSLEWSTEGSVRLMATITSTPSALARFSRQPGRICARSFSQRTRRQSFPPAVDQCASDPGVLHRGLSGAARLYDQPASGEPVAVHVAGHYSAGRDAPELHAAVH